MRVCDFPYTWMWRQWFSISHKLKLNANLLTGGRAADGKIRFCPSSLKVANATSARNWKFWTFVAFPFNFTWEYSSSLNPVIESCSCHFVFSIPFLVAEKALTNEIYQVSLRIMNRKDTASVFILMVNSGLRLRISVVCEDVPTWWNQTLDRRLENRHLIINWIINVISSSARYIIKRRDSNQLSYLYLMILI